LNSFCANECERLFQKERLPDDFAFGPDPDQRDGLVQCPGLALDHGDHSRGIDSCANFECHESRVVAAVLQIGKLGGRRSLFAQAAVLCIGYDAHDLTLDSAGVEL
jgi:hypothetical protein